MPYGLHMFMHRIYPISSPFCFIVFYFKLLDDACIWSVEAALFEHFWAISVKFSALQRMTFHKQQYHCS